MSAPALCPLCASDRSTVIREKLRYDVRRDVLKCQDCSFVYLRRRTPEESRAFYESSTYRNTYGPDLTKKTNCREAFDLYLPFQAPIIERLKPVLRPDTKILDVGCSTGHFLAALKGHVGVRVGLEPSADENAFIRENLDFPVYGEPIETAVIPEGPFDLVTALQVVEHIDDPIPFLCNAGRHLKPDGYLYIELPNLRDILLELYDAPGFADFYYRDPHVSYYTKETLGLLMDKAGFTGTIDNVQRFNFPNHLHWKLTGKPQPNFVLGNRDPVLVDDPARASTPAGKDFNDFMRRVDADYKALVEQHGLGESLTFLGKKKS